VIARAPSRRTRATSPDNDAAGYWQEFRARCDADGESRNPVPRSNCRKLLNKPAQPANQFRQLPLPSQPSFGNNQPLDVRPAVAAPIQQRGRPVLRPLQVPAEGRAGYRPLTVASTEPDELQLSRNFICAVDSRQHFAHRAARARCIRHAEPPWKPGLPAPQPRPNRSPQRPSWRPGDPVNTAPPLMTPRDLVSTAKIPHGPFP
jgi:hypothetical protein